MKREAPPLFSEERQHALDQYTQVLQHIEDLSPVTVRNYLSNLCQFIAWCDVQENHSFTPQTVAPSLLIRYRDYLQTTCGLRPTRVNRTLISLKRYFIWTQKTLVIQFDSASPIKFMPKEASPPRHLSDEGEDALVTMVNATGTRRGQNIITRLFHTSLHVQKLCTLTLLQQHLRQRLIVKWLVRLNLGKTISRWQLAIEGTSHSKYCCSVLEESSNGEQAH